MTSELEHVRIEYAGAHGGDSGFCCPPTSSGLATDGAVKIFDEPSSAFITDSTIVESSTHGIYRAWTGAAVDFLATNTLAGIAGCAQVLPKTPPGGTCPADPTCPLAP